MLTWQCICMFHPHKEAKASSTILPSCKFLSKLRKKSPLFVPTNLFGTISNEGLHYNHLALVSQVQFLWSILFLTKYYISKEWWLVWNWIVFVKIWTEGIHKLIILLHIHTCPCKGFFLLQRQVNPKFLHNNCNNVEIHDDCFPVMKGIAYLGVQIK